jgi:putative transposase
MGKPYSLDLRKRVVAAIEGGLSRNRAAKQFGVAISTAIGWMQRLDQTGSVAPGQMGGHKPKTISGEHAIWLSQRIKNDDFTLRELVAGLAGAPSRSTTMKPNSLMFASSNEICRSGCCLAFFEFGLRS